MEHIEQWDDQERELRGKIEATLNPKDKLLLVLSDSHGDLTSVIDIITRWEKYISAVFFLGDGAEELLEAAYIFPDLPFYGVTGNNDPQIAPNSRLNFPLENVVEIAGKRIYFTHGHIASYKAVVASVIKRAKEHHADIALHGHLHIPAEKEIEGIQLFSPGAIRYPRGGSKRGYLLLKLDKDCSAEGYFSTFTK